MKFYQIIVSILIGAALGVWYTYPVSPRVEPVKELGATYKTIDLITSTSAVSATSSDINIQGAKRVTLYLNNASGSSTSVTTYSVDASIDGTNFVDYNKLITNVANSNSQTPIRAVSHTITATGTAIVSMDLQYDYIKTIRAIKTYTLGGTGTSTGSVKAIIEY